MRRAVALLVSLAFSPVARAQEPVAPSRLVDTVKQTYEVLMTKPVRLSLEPIAPVSGIVLGVGFQPKPWRTESMLKIPVARASVSMNKYWAVDGSFAWQHVSGREWRIEPYARFRSMKRLNDFGIGNETVSDSRADFSMLDRRGGVYGYTRPVGWLAVGGRGEGLWPRTDNGQAPDLPSVSATFSPGDLPGFMEATNYVYTGVFMNLNYPYVRSERPRRGGDYMAALGTYHDVSGTHHSFTRFELEGQERFPLPSIDAAFTIHGRLSASATASDHSVPFYLMDTLGGADNLRGFKESIIGGDEATSTLRSFESFRFRDRTTALIQVDLRKRLWSQIFISAFGDAGVVAPSLGQLSKQRLHRGMGVGVSVYRANALAVRVEVSAWGGEGHPHYVTTGRGLQF